VELAVGPLKEGAVPGQTAVFVQVPEVDLLAPGETDTGMPVEFSEKPGGPRLLPRQRKSSMSVFPCAPVPPGSQSVGRGQEGAGSVAGESGPPARRCVGGSRCRCQAVPEPAPLAAPRQDRQPGGGRSRSHGAGRPVPAAGRPGWAAPGSPDRMRRCGTAPTRRGRPWPAGSACTAWVPGRSRPSDV
jgi:hypothetical protein